MTRCLICADPVVAPGWPGKAGRMCHVCLTFAAACSERQGRSGGVQFDIAYLPGLCAEIRYRAHGPCLLLGCGPNGFFLKAFLCQQ